MQDHRASTLLRRRGFVIALATVALATSALSACKPVPPGPAVVADPTVTPGRPGPGEPIRVSARLTAGSTATLTYRVMFGPEVPVAMLDDAASPGGAGDGVYGATIPAQSAGKLVRYRIDALTAGVAVSEPTAGDSVRFRGVVVRDPAVTSELPVIEWFMDDAVYDDLLTNHRDDDVDGDAVWSYDGQVFDGVLMHVRGNSSRAADKVSWKVEFPKGYEFDLGGLLPYPLDEFALQRYAPSFADVAWDTVRKAGNRGLNIQPVRTQRNGQFWSLSRVMETMDGRWRGDQGVKKWSIYKANAGAVGATPSPAALQDLAWLDKKSRKDEDYTDVWKLSNTVDAAPSDAQLAWIYQNVNVPELINYMATNAIIRHHDSGWYNWWLARDTEGTGRWEMWHWDLDYTFTTPERDGKGPFLTPDTSNRFTRAMLAYPDFREMYFRRLRTLADQFLAPGGFETTWDDIAARTGPDWSRDRAKWGGYSPASARTAFLASLADRRSVIAANTGAGKPVPVSQSADASVVINEIQYRPAGPGGEFLELTNPGSSAVDISGWTIDPIGLTVQSGTVIPAGGFLVFVSDDVAFRQAYAGANRLVGGQFSGSLDDAGDTIVVRQGERIVDQVTYDDAAPWPEAAAGTGPSLELTTPGAENADPANWRAASTTGGTPAMANTTVAGGPTTVEVPFGSTWRYDDSRADLGTPWRSPGHADGAWASGPGQFGFGEGDEATVLATGPSNARITTAYFRKTITLSDAGSITGAVLDLICDDGAVVYLNGTEILRSNMPAGAITARTYASTNKQGPTENVPVSYLLPPSALRAGSNTLAVEVHQKYRASSDLSFDAQLTVTR